MAFAFFRRRQKMVIIIMAILMVSFLIGFQGFSELYQRRPEQAEIGQTPRGKIIAKDLAAAESSISLLGRFIGLGDIQRMMAAKIPGDVEFLDLSRGVNPGLAWALLLQEADKMGFAATDADIDAFLDRVGKPTGSAEYNALLSRLREDKIQERDLLAAIRDWLMIFRAYTAAAVSVPDSEPALAKLYDDTVTSINLAMVKFPAQEYVAKIPEPTAAEIEAQYAKYRNVAAETFAQPEDFGFGYRFGNRVQISYGMAHRDIITQVTTPSDATIRKYLNAHQSEYTTTQPAGVKRNMEFAEAKPRIAAKLQAEAVATKLEDVIARLEKAAKQAPKDQPNPFAWAVAQMTDSAESLLAIEIPAISIVQEPLDEAIPKLAQAAGIDAICFPYGTHGKVTIDRSLKVTLAATNIKLGDALAKITAQAKAPQLAWKTCKGFEGVLFPAGEGSEITVLPVSAEQTGLLDERDFIANRVLIASQTVAGQPLGKIAFKAKEFLAEDQSSSALSRQGEFGPQMILEGPEGGMLAWRLDRAEPAAEPLDLAQVQAQVVKDLKILKAMELARQDAEKFLLSLKDQDLKKAAEAAKLKSLETDLFARKEVASPVREDIYRAQMQGIRGLDLYAVLMKAKPAEIRWSVVPHLAVPPGDDLRQKLIAEVFDLAPAKVDPPYTDKPSKMLVAPSLREVAVVQRIDFRRAAEPQFRETGRERLLSLLQAIAEWENRNAWFDLQSIQNRTGYKRAQ